MPLHFNPTQLEFYNSEYVDNLETLELDSTKSAKRVAIVDASGVQITTFGSTAATTGTLSSVSGSASSQTLLALNTSRKGFVIHNDSTAILYVAYAATATTSAFTYRINPYQTLEIGADKNYTGVVSGIWASADGNARITSLT